MLLEIPDICARRESFVSGSLKYNYPYTGILRHVIGYTRQFQPSGIVDSVPLGRPIDYDPSDLALSLQY